MLIIKIIDKNIKNYDRIIMYRIKCGDILENNILIISVAAFVVVILVVLTVVIIKKIQNDKYKREIENLDIEKNQLVDVTVLTEMSKVKDLIKTENLKEKLNEWNTTFTLIKDERIPKLTDLINEADFLVTKKEYKGAVRKIANIEMELHELKDKSNILLNEMRLITSSEERNRTSITKLKIEYRELQSKFERTIKDYGDVAPSLVLRFEIIEKRFQDFENFIDKNDYVEVEKIVINLNELISSTKELLEEIPSIVIMSEMLIPKKIEETSTLYARMIRDGYPLDYLNVEYNIKEINGKIKEIIDKLKLLNLEDASLELKTILGYFDKLFKDFDRERECKNVFIENSKIVYRKLDKINKVVNNIFLSLDDIKLTYDLSEEAINKFVVINKNLEMFNNDYNELIKHSKGKTFAYSRLLDELDGLSNKVMRLQDDLDVQLHSISSMKDDEYRAKEQLESIEKLLKQTKNRLKDYKVPVVPSSYWIELKEAQDAIKEIVKELSKKPIVIKILNIRVDTARDLVFKIYNKTNDLIKTSMLAERVIIYGNRYRSTYDEIDASLKKAEDLYRKGLYEQSIDISVKGIEFIESDILSKIA